MGIYFRDILLISISRGANNCGQHSLEKNIYFIMRFFSPPSIVYFNDRLEFCEFFEWKIKSINNADLFSQTPFLTFIKGANISGGHCTCRESPNIFLTKCFNTVLSVYYFLLGILSEEYFLVFHKSGQKREREREREGYVLIQVVSVWWVYCFALLYTHIAALHYSKCEGRNNRELMYKHTMTL